MNKIIDNKLGKLFPPATIVGAYTFMVIGFYSIVEILFYDIDSIVKNILLGIFLIIVGSFIAFASKGILLDIENRKYKTYTNIFAYKQGEWKSLHDFQFITVLHKKLSSRAFSRSNRSAITSREFYYDICLLNSNHRKKLIIARYTDKEMAINKAKELSSDLNMNLASYNPKNYS